jgi:hypothetical protein
MPEQFEKLTTKEELSKIKPTPVERKEPIELTEEENKHLLNLLNQAKEAEKRGDLVTAIQLYEQYKREYQALREKKEREKEKKEREFKNGELICHYEGRWDYWYSHPQGVIIQIGKKFLLNGKDLLYEGKWDSWWPHPQGVIIRRGNDWFIYTIKK